MIIHNPILTGSLVFNGTNLTTSNLVTTGSNNFTGSQAISGSLNVTGNITATTLVVQTVSSSVIYSSGSNVFGNNIANTQVMTGSVSITGSLAVVTNGTELQVGATGVTLGNALTDSHVISGSLRVNPNGLFVSSSGIVGVGTLTPNSTFQVSRGGATFQVTDTNKNTSNSFSIYGYTQTSWAIATGNSGSFSGGEKIIITDSGNVGIATTTPMPWGGGFLGLSVGQASVGCLPNSANSYFANNVYYDGSFRRGIAAPVSIIQMNEDRLSIANSGTGTAGSVASMTERFCILANGNVGIGNANPSVKFNIWGGEMRWGFTSDLGALSFTDNKPMLASLGATDFLFYTNAAERMRISSNGSVQINGPTLSAGDPSTYALRVGQSGGVNLSLSWNSSAGYIQTFASTPLYLNQQGNAVFANGSAGFGQVSTLSSDIRIKKNITSIESALDKVNALRGVYYEFDENNELGISVPYGKTRVGLIAQEVETIIPEAVLDGDNESTPKSVDYTGLVGVLVKAIQELKAEIEILKTK